MSWTLLTELLVKSSVVAGAGLALSSLIAFRPASDRVDILRATVCLLLALPALLILGPRLPVAWLAAPASPAAIASAPSQTLILNFDPVADLALTAAVPAAPSWPVLAFALYIAGAGALIGRLALGTWTLWRWTRDGRTVDRPAWREALFALDPSARTHLVASTRVRTPLSWGLPPGVVLLSEDNLQRPGVARAVLAHELAHIRRGDWLFLMVSRLALALFWFNPLVWIVHRQLVARTEEAADAVAVAGLDRRTYARTLVDLADDVRQPAALAMAGHPETLARRIAHIMKTPRKMPARPLAMTLAIGALVAVATPLAAIEFVPRPPAPPAPPAAIAPPAPSLAIAPLAPLAPAAFVAVAPPAPPAPPAPIAQSSDARYVITRDGTTRTYRSLDEMDPATRREFEEAHAEGERARAAGEEARRQGERARIEGQRIAREAHAHAAEARAHAAAAVREGERAHREGMRLAARARADAEVAHREARSARIEARASMRSGAEEMMRGAEQMRSEGLRLRDADYRAEVIAEHRARGDTVTEAELIELSRSLPRQADDLERSARRLRDQASGEI